MIIDGDIFIDPLKEKYSLITELILRILPRYTIETTAPPATIPAPVTINIYFIPFSPRSCSKNDDSSSISYGRYLPARNTPAPDTEIIPEYNRSVFDSFNDSSSCSLERKSMSVTLYFLTYHWPFVLTNETEARKAINIILLIIPFRNYCNPLYWNKVRKDKNNSKQIRLNKNLSGGFF